MTNMLWNVYPNFGIIDEVEGWSLIFPPVRYMHSIHIVIKNALTIETYRP